MQSYVINLAERPERMAHIRETFGRAAIPFERFDAIGRDGIGEFELSRRLPPRHDGRPWLPFEIACLISHHELWKRIAADDAPFAAIFEDDIVIAERLRLVLAGDFPLQADLLKLETTCQVTYLNRSDIPMADGRGCFRRLLTLHEGTGAYIVSKRAAAKLVRAAFRFEEPLDRSLFSPRLWAREGLDVYQAVPAVAVQGIFVTGLRDTATMQSDRLEDFKLAPVEQAGGSPVRWLSQIIVRLWRQVRGQRIIVPFDGDERLDQARQ